jgi:hypothetical protein
MPKTIHDFIHFSTLEGSFRLKSNQPQRLQMFCESDMGLHGNSRLQVLKKSVEKSMFFKIRFLYDGDIEEGLDRNTLQLASFFQKANKFEDSEQEAIFLLREDTHDLHATFEDF